VIPRNRGRRRADLKYRTCAAFADAIPIFCGTPAKRPHMSVSDWTAYR
jgi:hypothetical protein